MQVYNPATKATADVPDKSYPTWALSGWVPADLPLDEPPEGAEVEKAKAEATAEDTGRGRHPSAKATKDK